MDGCPAMVEVRPRPIGRVTVAVAMIAVVMVQLDVSAVTIAVADLGRVFAVSAGDASWVINAYSLVFASLLLNAGVLVDRIGTRRAFIAGFTIFTVSSLACGLAPGWHALLAARAVQGGGAALLFPTALTLIQQSIIEPRVRARAIGWWSAAGSAALAGGPVLGGALIALSGWRLIFLLNIPVGAVGLWLAWHRLPRLVRARPQRADVSGQLLGAALLTCIVVLVQEGTHFGWEGGWLRLGGAGAFILAAAFAIVERLAPEPIISRALLAGTGFVRMAAIGAIMNFVFYGLVFALSLHFQAVQHLDALGAGLALAPMMLALVATNPLAGWFDHRLGSARTIVTGVILLSAGCLALVMARGTAAWLPLLPGLLFIGGGTAMAVPALAKSALADVPEQLGGTASGVYNAARQIGGAVGVALFGSMFDGTSLSQGGLGTAGGIAAAASLIAVPLAVRRYAASRRSQHGNI